MYSLLDGQSVTVGGMYAGACRSNYTRDAVQPLVDWSVDCNYYRPAQRAELN